MATNVKKAMKKPVIKKNYNTKLPLFIAGGLAALIVIIVAVYFIIFAATNYVAKIDGEKIYNYEYQYFLTNVIGDMQSEAKENGDIVIPDSGNEADTEAAYMAFWTDEKKQEAADKALEEAKEYKIGYLLAKKNGFDLTSEEKDNVKSSVDSNISYYYQIYAAYGYSYSYDDIVRMFCGTISVTEYKKIAIKMNVTEKYRQSFIDTYSATDDELRAIYDENPDDYRTVSARVMYLKYPDAPSAITEKAPTREDGTEVKEGDEDFETYKEAYETYKAAKEAYDKKKADYDAEVKAINERADKIAADLNANGKYTEYQLDEDGNPKKDTDGNDVYLYNEATFVEIIKAESKLGTPSEDGGLKSVNNSSLLSVTDVDKLILSYQWDTAREGFVIVEKEEEDENEEEENPEIQEEPYEEGGSATEETEETEEVKGKNPTDITVVKVSSGVYLVRCEDITDFDNSVESSEGAADSIKDTIKATLFDEKAQEELDEKIESSGDAYNVVSKKNDKMLGIVTSVIEEQFE